MPRFGFVCETSDAPNVWVKPALLYTPRMKFASDENVYAPRTDRGYTILSSFQRKSVPALNACAPAWCVRLLTTWYRLFTRRVGLPELVPKDATPAMLTAGPIGSDGGAFRSPCTNCARVSSTVRADSVHVLLRATA